MGYRYPCFYDLNVCFYNRDGESLYGEALFASKETVDNHLKNENLNKVSLVLKKKLKLFLIT